MPRLPILRALSPTLRLTLAVAGVSAWLVLLSVGIILGGAVYLLLAAALVVFPWGELKAGDPPPES